MEEEDSETLEPGRRRRRRPLDDDGGGGGMGQQRFSQYVDGLVSFEGRFLHNLPKGQGSA